MRTHPNAFITKQPGQKTMTNEKWMWLVRSQGEWKLVRNGEEHECVRRP